MATKYKCQNCKHTFTEDEMGYSSEWIGDDRYSSNSSGYIYYDACPECGSTEIVEAEECCCCGEWFDKEDMIEDNDLWFCKECGGRIYDAYYLKWGRLEEEKNGSI